MVEVRADRIEEFYFGALGHHLDQAFFQRRFTGQGRGTNQGVQVLGDRRAFGDEGAVFQLQYRQRERRALAIYTAVAGAQLIARTRLDIGLFDELILSYQAAGLIPA
jgi:hypothetical protein